MPAGVIPVIMYFSNVREFPALFSDSFFIVVSCGFFSSGIFDADFRYYKFIYIIILLIAIVGLLIYEIKIKARVFIIK